MFKVFHLNILPLAITVAVVVFLLVADSYGHESSYLPKAKEQSNHLAAQPEHDDDRLQNAIGAAGYIV